MDGRAEVIEELRALITEQAAQLEQQAAQLEQQAARIAELELALAKAKKNSATSSKPPSSDLTNPRPKHQRPGRRKKPRRGAQPGHQRQVRELLLPERVDETFDYEIAEDAIRRLHLTPTGDFDILQHLELPDTPVYVTEHRLAVYRAPDEALYIPDVPELHGPICGPRLLATIGWLKSVGHLSYSTIEAWMEDVLQVPVSRGYLAKLCTGTISAALADAYDQLTAAIPQQAQLGSDETSLKDNGKTHWIWCITAATFSVFHIAATRSRAVLEKLIGPEFAGYLHFDYFSANRSFVWNFWIKAQYCWAHLIRDIRFLQTHPDTQTQAWAEQLLERARRLFAAWHRRNEMSAQGLHRSMLTHRDRFLQVVR
jgi:transposase